ncbi:MAG: bifunctional [glutamine synthetase] adenylyltransferase/[glutamine synthetase]-adenylyl-L-tyrosine phosphorylase, partial [Propionibacteriaceae bacterium]|nr:bifunctional [glutamine synthetase] adenylyltransferase/[glutamine synthetase]-adenylyl-L-tyrosine phosphorylase [Propionibacteriaceae bacterium]
MIGSDSLQLMLARLGFANITKLSSTVQSWKCDDAAIVAILEKLATAPDRDLAFSAFARLIDSNQELPSLLAADAQWMDTLARVLGSSVALGQFLAVNPTELETLRVENPRCNVKQLRRELLRSVGADPDATVPIADPTRSDDLRRAYHHAVLQIAARDVTAADQLDILPDIAVELSALADGTVEAALALARGEVSDSQKCRLGIIAMGKAGAKELNYVSDVDLIFVAEPALDAWGKPLCDSTQAIAVATKLASALSRICSDHTSAGTIWKIDPNLRPEGKQGALVRTLSSYQTYYEKWAKNWEFQALMKARPMAGDIALAGEFVDMIWPMVWSVADDDQFVPQMQAMRQRVISLLSPKVADREIKLGAGGLRDVEFTVQLLQLVHGRADERLRLRGTFEALEKLVAYGYVGRQDGNDLASAYRLLRVLEHRLQLYRMQRTHLLPADDYAQTWLARGIGLEQPKELTQLWRATTRKVLTLHHRMFYSPLLEAVARIPTAQVRLTSQAAQTRLQALGYSDPKAALKHIAALSQGMSRQAEIQRQILPAMLGWFTQGPNPDHGLLAFRQVSEKLGRSPWYLRALRDGGITAQHFAKILASSRYAVDLLLRNPQSAALLGDTAGLVPVERETILDEMLRSARRHESVTDAAAAIRSVRRRELLRLAMGNLIGDLELSALGKALSDVTSATIDAGLDVAKRGVSDVPEIAVIALGRWGGQEMSYASDADAMFVCDDIKAVEGINAATTVINRLRSL